MNDVGGFRVLSERERAKILDGIESENFDRPLVLVDIDKKTNRSTFEKCRWILEALPRGERFIIAHNLRRIDGPESFFWRLVEDGVGLVGGADECALRFGGYSKHAEGDRAHSDFRQVALQIWMLYYLLEFDGEAWLVSGCRECILAIADRTIAIFRFGSDLSVEALVSEIEG